MKPTTQRVSSQDVEQYAYLLYEQRGCQPGHELDDWLEAERQLANGGALMPVEAEQSNSSRTGPAVRRSKPKDGRASESGAAIESKGKL